MNTQSLIVMVTHGGVARHQTINLTHTITTLPACVEAILPLLLQPPPADPASLLLPADRVLGAGGARAPRGQCG